MSERNDAVLIVITAPDGRSADRLARGMVEKRLAACVNIVPGIRSTYWWEGAVQSAEEVLLLVKARREDVETLAGYVRSEHPYDVPEVIATEIVDGLGAYLDWVFRETERD